MGGQKFLEFLNGLLVDPVHRQLDPDRTGLVELCGLEDLHVLADHLREVLPSVDSTPD